MDYLTRARAREALLYKIRANDESMDCQQSVIDSHIAVYGLGNTDHLYETLDRLRVHGRDMREDLKELDAEAMKSPAKAGWQVVKLWVDKDDVVHKRVFPLVYERAQDATGEIVSLLGGRDPFRFNSAEREAGAILVWQEVKPEPEPAPAMIQQQAQLQQADASKPASGPACEACGRPLSDPESVKAGVGPVCRAHGHTRRQLHMWEFFAGADYESEIVGDVLCLIDLDQGGPTITNNVEAVIADLVYRKIDLTHLSLIYRDTRGVWDEIVVQDGRFAGFRSINVRHRCEALEVIARRRIQTTPVTVMSVTDFLSAGAAAFTEVARIETDQDGRVSSAEFPR
ncbi:DUF6011 domain-containing protein [Methylobacterium sp. SD21]|uniref:DUF6011 domain-containing protein n=1 Tax=Methylobacterium litchii TaxID=3138810 RepID=UPI00313ADB8A